MTKPKKQSFKRAWQVTKYRKALIHALSKKDYFGGCVGSITHHCDVMMADSTARKHLDAMWMEGRVLKCTFGTPHMWALDVGQHQRFYRRKGGIMMEPDDAEV